VSSLTTSGPLSLDNPAEAMGEKEGGEDGLKLLGADKPQSLAPYSGKSNPTMLNSDRYRSLSHIALSYLILFVLFDSIGIVYRRIDEMILELRRKHDRRNEILSEGSNAIGDVVEMGGRIAVSADEEDARSIFKAQDKVHGPIIFSWFCFLIVSCLILCSSVISTCRLWSWLLMKIATLSLMAKLDVLYLGATSSSKEKTSS
jgi:hypothetical protein